MNDHIEAELTRIERLADAIAKGDRVDTFSAGIAELVRDLTRVVRECHAKIPVPNKSVKRPPPTPPKPL